MSKYRNVELQVIGAQLLTSNGGTWDQSDRASGVVNIKTYDEKAKASVPYRGQYISLKMSCLSSFEFVNGVRTPNEELAGQIFYYDLPLEPLSARGVEQVKVLGEELLTSEDSDETISIGEGMFIKRGVLDALSSQYESAKTGKTTWVINSIQKFNTMKLKSAGSSAAPASKTKSILSGLLKSKSAPAAAAPAPKPVNPVKIEEDEIPFQ